MLKAYQVDHPDVEYYAFKDEMEIFWEQSNVEIIYPKNKYNQDQNLTSWVHNYRRDWLIFENKRRWSLMIPVTFPTIDRYIFAVINKSSSNLFPLNRTMSPTWYWLESLTRNKKSPWLANSIVGRLTVISVLATSQISNLLPDSWIAVQIPRYCPYEHVVLNLEYNMLYFQHLYKSLCRWIVVMYQSCCEHR